MPANWMFCSRGCVFLPERWLVIYVPLYQDFCAPIVEHINTARTGHRFHPSVVGVQSNMRIMLACRSYECFSS